MSRIWQRDRTGQRGRTGQKGSQRGRIGQRGIIGQKNGVVWMMSMAAALLLSGCGAGIPIVSDSGKSYDYPKAQAMIVVATERNRYEQVYTDEIWDVTLEDGKTFETYLLEQVQGFLKDLKTMSLLADSQEISVSSAERDRLNQLAEEYYQGLSQGDIQYTGASLEDVEALYEEYYVANKLVGELTKEMDLEVSDSEAKVIILKQIVVNDSETAKDIYGKVTEEGSDFTAIAKEMTEAEEIEVSIGRGEVPAALEENVFSLAVGEISPVISRDGSYYIFQCVNDYDAEATKERKAQLYEERKNQAFAQIYAQFQTEHEVTFTDPLWSELHFSEEDQTSTTDFFTLYQEEFGSQGY